MKREDEFEAFLADHLDEAPLPDDGFTEALRARLSRHRRRRRFAMLGAVVVDSVIAAVVVSLSPLPVFTVADVTPEAVVAILFLLAGCSFVWIDTVSMGGGQTGRGVTPADRRIGSGPHVPL